MNKTFIAFLCTAIFAICGITSCNKDEFISTVGKPEIILDGDGTGVYYIRIGETRTIAPQYKNADNARFEWVFEGETVSTRPSWSYTGTTAGEYFVELTVTNETGTVSEELKIVVGDARVPVISLPLPEEGITLPLDSKYLLSPRFGNDELEPFSVTWFVNGTAVSTERTYTFPADEPGTYAIKIVATNAEGSSQLAFEIHVTDQTEYGISFSQPLYFTVTEHRYTFVNRPVCLSPILTGFRSPSFRWSVDGTEADTQSDLFVFHPEKPGQYTVTVEVSEEDITLKKDITVVCVPQSEEEQMREYTGSSSAFSTKVFEYLPAPGQFVGEAPELHTTTPDKANEWAMSRLKQRNYVSLGAFGGYLVVGFDHSIKATSAEYDFAIEGNAFVSETGGSNEPGIVWVMQDVNGNGLPDEEWYQLKGSEYGKEETREHFAVTYFRPSGKGMDVPWITQDGKNGQIDYLEEFHNQDFYYPSWVEASSYTLRGTMLAAKRYLGTDGIWKFPPYAWGYADNTGADSFQKSVNGKTGQFTGFKISHAIREDGTPIELKYIDYVKVQSGTLSTSGWTGESSTEVLSIMDMNDR